jgi:hypothetical protein
VRTRALAECRKRIARKEYGDGLDNDSDGTVDFPTDPECTPYLGEEGVQQPSPAPPTSATPTPNSSSISTRKPFDGDFAVS